MIAASADKTPAQGLAERTKEAETENQSKGTKGRRRPSKENMARDA